MSVSVDDSDLGTKNESPLLHDHRTSQVAENRLSQPLLHLCTVVVPNPHYLLNRGLPPAAGSLQSSLSPP